MSSPVGTREQICSKLDVDQLSMRSHTSQPKQSQIYILKSIDVTHARYLDAQTWLSETLIDSIPTRVVGRELWPIHDTGHVVLRHRSLELMVFRRPEIVTG